MMTSPMLNKNWNGRSSIFAFYSVTEDDNAIIFAAKKYRIPYIIFKCGVFPTRI